jgi:hypothetical protein
MKFRRPKSGEWVQPKRRGYKLACCDCGLVHTMDFRVHAGKPQFRAMRNERSTALMRRPRKRPAVEPIEIPGLDPGIALTVAFLRQHGLKTTDSGDGRSKPADERTIDAPHVHVVCEALDMVPTSKLMAKLLGNDWDVEAAYSPRDGVTIVTAIKRGAHADERVASAHIGETVHMSGFDWKPDTHQMSMR